MHVWRACLVLVVLDVLWVTLFMRHRYEPMLVAIQGHPPSVRPVPAVLAYLLMLLGLHQFVVQHEQAGLRGALFGLVVYGVYHATCASVITDWDTNLAFVDVAWGAFVFAVAGLASKR